MENLKQKRLLITFIIVLAILNIAMLGTFWMSSHRPHHPKQGHQNHERHDHGLKILTEKLNLSDKQQETFKELRKVHFEKMESIQMNLKDKKDAFFKEMTSQNSQDFSVLTVQTSIGSPSSPSVASPFSKPRHNALLSNITSTTKRRGSLYVHHLTQDATVSDKALQSFLNIIALLERSPAVQMYAKSSALQAKLPGFRVRMGFGLHLGWGIEVRSFFVFGLLHCSM